MQGESHAKAHPCEEIPMQIQFSHIGEAPGEQSKGFVCQACSDDAELLEDRKLSQQKEVVDDRRSVVVLLCAA